jgi:hypothetical protein
MGQLMKTLKKTPVGKLDRSLMKRVSGSDKTWDQLHPLEKGVEDQYDARKATEKAAAEVENAPVIPLPDEEELERVNRRRGAKRGGGRASTVLTDEALGG